jgi:hypothetical protein
MGFQDGVDVEQTLQSLSKALLATGHFQQHGVGSEVMKKDMADFTFLLFEIPE